LTPGTRVYRHDTFVRLDRERSFNKTAGTSADLVARTW
jgi:hypothetical protein